MFTWPLDGFFGILSARALSPSSSRSWSRSVDEVYSYTSWWSGTGDEVVGDGDNRMEGGQRCVVLLVT